jgi:hypothetical protein
MDGKDGRAHVANNGEPVPAAPDPSGPPDEATRRVTRFQRDARLLEMMSILQQPEK